MYRHELIVLILVGIICTLGPSCSNPAVDDDDDSGDDDDDSGDDDDASGDDDDASGDDDDASGDDDDDDSAGDDDDDDSAGDDDDDDSAGDDDDSAGDDDDSGDDDDDSGDDDDDDSAGDDDDAVGDDDDAVGDDDDSAGDDDDSAGDDDDSVGDDDDSAPTECHGLYFDGGLDFIHVLHDQSLTVGAPMTIEAWVRPHAGVVNSPWWPNLIGKRNSNSIVPSWALGLDPSLELYTTGNGSFLDGNTPLALNSWVHVAAVWNGVTLRTFVDGQVDLETAASSMGTPNGEDVYLGTLPGNTQNYEGDIASVRVSQVARYASSFVPTGGWQPDGDTALLLTLEEGSGPVAGDISGLNNDGVIAGADWISGLPTWLCSP
jgi:hypothetical protein